MIRNFFIISFSLILFYGNVIYGAENNELDAIDVLATLESKVPDCSLAAFVASESDLKKLTEDLKTYCSTSSKQYALICRMLAYELEKACQLPPKKRPSPAMYETKKKPSEICGSNKIQLTNRWILNKLSNNEEKKLNVSPKDLCEKVTSDDTTIRLARFFYKIAPRVRDNDSPKQNKGSDQADTNEKSLKESVLDTGKKINENADETAQTLKTKGKDAAEATGDKIGETADQVKTKAKDAAEAIGSKIGETVEQVKTKIKDAAEATGDKISETADQVKTKGKDAAEATGDKISETADEVKTKAKDAAGATGDKISETADQVKTNAKDAAEATGDKISETADQVKTKAKDAAEATGNKTSETVDQIKTKSKDAAEAIGNKISETIDQVKTKAKDAAEATGKKISETVDQIKTKVEDVRQTIVNKTGEAIKGISNKADEIEDKAKDKIDSADKSGKEADNQVDGAVKKLSKDTTNDTRVTATIKTTQDVVTVKSKADEAVKDAKDNVTAVQNVTSNIASNSTTKDVESVKKDPESTSNTTNKGTKLNENATKELEPKTVDDKKPAVLDLNDGKKTEIDKKTDPTNDDDTAEDDENKNKNQPVVQTTKSNLPANNDDQKAEEEIVEKKTTKSKDSPVDKSNLDKNAETGKNNNEDVDPDEMPLEQENELKKKDPQIDGKDKIKSDDDNLLEGEKNLPNDSEEELETNNQVDNNENSHDQVDENQLDGMKIRPPNQEEKFGKDDGKIPEIVSPKQRIGTKLRDKNRDDDGWSGGFVTYFLLFTLFVVIGYLILHNKNKLMAYVVEGRRAGGSRTGSRPSHRGYEKLKNLNDVIPIDDANPISDKEVIILKS